MSKKRERELARENESILFENQKIVDVDMEHEVKKSFIEYSMSVITLYCGRMIKCKSTTLSHPAALMNTCS